MTAAENTQCTVPLSPADSNDPVDPSVHKQVKKVKEMEQSFLINQ